MKIRGIPMISLFIGFFAISIGAVFAVMLIIVNSTIDREYRSEIAAKNGLVARSAAREAGTFLDSYFGALAVVAARPSARTASPRCWRAWASASRRGRRPACVPPRTPRAARWSARSASPASA